METRTFFIAGVLYWANILDRKPKPYLFHGLFRTGQGYPAIGELYDKWGPSEIKVGIFDQADLSDSNLHRGVNFHLEFSKQYKSRKDLIYYSFRREASGIYVGSFNGNASGRGLAKCAVSLGSAEFGELSDSEAREAEAIHDQQINEDELRRRNIVLQTPP